MLPAGRVDMSVKELKEKGNAAFKMKKYEVSEWYLLHRLVLLRFSSLLST